jgi:hypothetical protein
MPQVHAAPVTTVLTSAVSPGALDGNGASTDRGRDDGFSAGGGGRSAANRQHRWSPERPLEAASPWQRGRLSATVGNGGAQSVIWRHVTNVIDPTAAAAMDLQRSRRAAAR